MSIPLDVNFKQHDRLVKAIIAVRDLAANTQCMSDEIENIHRLLSVAQAGRSLARTKLLESKKTPRQISDELRYRRAFIKSQKRVPCHDCDERKSPSLMTYDHVPGWGQKLFTLGSDDDVEHRSFEEIKLEISKCQVVCRDCHDKREISRGR